MSFPAPLRLKTPGFKAKPLKKQIGAAAFMPNNGTFRQAKLYIGLSRMLKQMGITLSPKERLQLNGPNGCSTFLASMENAGYYCIGTYKANARNETKRAKAVYGASNVYAISDCSLTGRRENDITKNMVHIYARKRNT